MLLPLGIICDRVGFSVRTQRSAGDVARCHFGGGGSRERGRLTGRGKGESGSESGKRIPTHSFPHLDIMSRRPENARSVSFRFDLDKHHDFTNRQTISQTLRWHKPSHTRLYAHGHIFRLGCQKNEKAVISAGPPVKSRESLTGERFYFSDEKEE